MPLIPRGFHRPAGSGPAYGFHVRTAARPPIEHYTGTIERVPLGDGQAQGIIGLSGAATVQVGPQGLGTVWYPASVTIWTTTGVNDASVCNIYAGPPTILTPTQLLGTILTGGSGTLAAAVPPVPVGWYLTAVWSGGHQGDTATINVIGSKDALVRA